MSDLKTLKSALETETKALEALVTEFSNPASDAVKVDGDRVVVDEKAYKAVTEHKENIAKLRTILGLEGDVKDARKFLVDPSVEKARFADKATEHKSIADHLLDSEEFKDMIANNRNAMRNDVQLDIADIIQRKDVYSSVGSYSATYGIGSSVQQLPMVPAVQHRQRVRDLFPAASTTSNLLEYWRSLGLNNNGIGSAATVAERLGDNSNFALKPKSDLSFEHASDRVSTIAHWVPAHRNTLSDNAQLRSIIDNQLLYGLAQVEDYQLLLGDGIGENVLGLLNRPGIQSYTPAGGEIKSDSLRRAQTLSELAGFPSTGYVVHPLDWEDVELLKGSTNDHYMLTTNIAVGIQSRVWRLPVVSTPVIPEGTFLSAAFGQACQVYDREKANIRVAEQHSDFFVRNAVVVLAEERLALTCAVPSAVVAGTFA